MCIFLGKIAGTLIWVNFDRHALLNLVNSLGGTFIANIDDIRPEFRTDENAFLSQNAIYQGTLVRDSGQTAGATIDQMDTQMTAVSGMKEEAKPWYSDQILPFDITLAGTNEQGAATTMKIFGVEILNEGSGVSIDDAVTEMQATFVARFVEPWQAVQSRKCPSKVWFYRLHQVLRDESEKSVSRGARRRWLCDAWAHHLDNDYI